MKYKINLLFGLFLVACSSSEDNFNLCSTETRPYYYPSLEYEGGFYKIKDFFYKSYKPVNDLNNTGIIRIQFQVNCVGETGNYSVDTYTLDFKKTSLNDPMVMQFLKLTKSLNRWIPAVNNDGETINSHKFFAFRLLMVN